MTLIELLNLETGASPETLNRIISTAPKRYKIYEIEKRNGGTRTIAHPARELKTIQRIILRCILDNIKVSEIATAYVKGRGISYNANLHAGQRWILKLDFRNFFHSIVPRDWDRVVRRADELRHFSKDANLFHKILFWGAGGWHPQCLSIGAPTSPAVSNLVCGLLDSWMIENAKRLDVRVTRYADDITVSGDRVAGLIEFERRIGIVLEKSQGLRLTLNSEKRGLFGPGQRKMVTGLILTPDGGVSIGRERKREISALIHRFSHNSIEMETVARAKGLLAFAMSVEPDFFAAMRRKYGEEVIDALMRSSPDSNFLASDIEL